MKGICLSPVTRAQASQEWGLCDQGWTRRAGLLSVTPEAIGFLSAVGVFVVLLALLFLFINKKLCFEKVGGLPCLELKRKRKRVREKAGIHRGLAQNKVTGMLTD
ncbi:hypothetical protein chiPu_0014395 [Chiloscyllium punctatum]|uniref:Uncharacterized protein n=1 Tax=Chiloscyllium punctatum TaxID=137246 RepID=A0A401SZS5_CHIPU|nr:hypothetical protein [Chiloscyllium punctatum]